MSFMFYKTNKNVLDFNSKTDIHKIVFNHYIMKKANLHRMKGDLPDGQFKFSARSAATDLGLSKSTISRMVNEFEAKNIINPVIKSTSGRACSVYEYIVRDNSKTIKNTGPFNETVSRTINKTLNTCDLKVLDDIQVPFAGTIDETVSGTSYIENINRELNKNNIYSRVIDYLNKKTNKKFRLQSTKTKAVISARLNEGFAEEDFYKVIDIKCEQWKSTDMEKFLRPETLFSNKFEGYLNESGQDVAENEEINSYKIEFNF